MIINNKNNNTHPAILHSAELNEICSPLNGLHGIDYFAHVNVDKSGSFSVLSTQPNFIEHYFNEKYFNCDIHLSRTDMKVESIIRDNENYHGETARLMGDCEAFKLHHIFTIIHKQKDATDVYHFATSSKNNRINDTYLGMTPLLQQFISYFKEQIKSNKPLNNAYNYKYRIDNQLAVYEANLEYCQNQNIIKEFISATSADRFHLFDENSSYITKREFECLIWLHHGKTAEEIAIILDITERTVRAHINSIKLKLKCKTMFQLGEKISQYNLLQLINQYKNK